MEATLREFVRRRAADRCEYCGIHQHEAPNSRFHIEHIVPQKHGGGDGHDNLALACIHCNLHTGPNLSGIDPLDGSICPLYHPRRDIWQEHFRPDGAQVIGLTPVGRATVMVLNMNAPDRVRLRHELYERKL